MTESNASNTQRAVAHTVAAGIAALFVLRCLHNFAGAGHDDTYITLLAAEQLVAGEGLVNANGAAGEIGSSLLHVLIVALVQLLGATDVYLANKLLGLSCGAATLYLVVAAPQLSPSNLFAR